MSNDEASEILKVDFKQEIVIDNVCLIHFVILREKKEIYLFFFRVIMLTSILIILCLFQHHIIASNMIPEEELSTRMSFVIYHHL